MKIPKNTLETLPVEVLYMINSLALTPALHNTSKRLYLVFLQATPTYTARFLVLWALQRHIGSLEQDGQCKVFWDPTVHHSPAALAQRAFRSPLCTPKVLKLVHEIILPLLQQVKSVAEGCATTHSQPAIIDLLGIQVETGPNSSTPWHPFVVWVPRRLFRGFEQDRAEPSTLPHPKLSNPLRMLRFLVSFPEYYVLNVNADGGYGVAKLVAVCNLKIPGEREDDNATQLLLFLLKQGVDLSLKGGLALRVAISRKSLRILKLLLDNGTGLGPTQTFSSRSSRSSSEKRGGVDKLKRNVVACAMKASAKEIVSYLVIEKGWNLNLQALSLVDSRRP